MPNLSTIPLHTKLTLSCPLETGRALGRADGSPGAAHRPTGDVGHIEKLGFPLQQQMKSLSSNSPHGKPCYFSAFNAFNDMKDILQHQLNWGFHVGLQPDLESKAIHLLL